MLTIIQQYLTQQDFFVQILSYFQTLQATLKRQVSILRELSNQTRDLDPKVAKA